MPGLVPGIHAFLLLPTRRGWPGQARPWRGKVGDSGLSPPLQLIKVERSGPVSRAQRSTSEAQWCAADPGSRFEKV